MKMQKKLLAGTAIALAGVFGLSACSASDAVPETPAQALTSGVNEAAAKAVPQSFRDSGVVRVASGIPYPPFILMDDEDQLSGFDWDLSQALGEKLGLKFEVKHQNFETVIPALQSKRFDVIMAGMNDSVEREKTLNFVDYLRAGFTIVVKKGNPQQIGTLLDLCGQTVAVQKSTIQGQILRDLVAECEAKGKPGVAVQELPVANDAQTALKAGKVDAYVTDAPVAAYTIKTSGGGNDFEGVEDPKNPQGFKPAYTGVGILKEQAGLTEAIHLALQSLIEEGVYKDLLAKHGMPSLGVDEAILNGAGK